MAIGTRLTAAFVALLVLSATVAAAGWIGLNHLYGRFQFVTDSTLPVLKAAAEMRDSQADNLRSLANLMLAASEADQAEARHGYGESLARFETNWKAYAPLVLDDTDRRNHEAVGAAFRNYREYSARMLELAQRAHGERGQAVDATAYWHGEYRSAYAPLDQSVQALWDHAEKMSHSADSAGDSAFRLSQRWMVSIFSLSAVVSAVLARLITRSITAPLDQAVRVADAVAGGDLTVRIGSDGRDELAGLARSLGRMLEHLRTVVSNVRSGVDAVATASAQIAAGNQDLSMRTEQQASSLQQTAASMEELSVTVRHNAETARRANELAATASDAAGRGGSVVGQVVNTMGRINDSSRRIGEIIGVIDGIAFQTNILALNAAVEAARAGDQGRGFAVVAGEVRALAQRSGQAAREIRALISDSEQKVESGMREVDDAGRTMQEIVEQVKAVAGMLGDISASSREQSSGIEQVNGAVTHLDQMTQQNAALVEQSAASAASLKSQADELAAAIAIFRLGDSGASPPQPAAVPKPVAALKAAASPKSASVAVPARPRAPAYPMAAATATAGAAQDWEEF